MAKDVVCAEAELSIAANNLVEYADFLCRTMEAYIAVLSEIQERGIQDDLVCSKPSAIALALKPYKTSIKDECEEVAIDVNAYMAGIASADCFQFPTGITATIDSLVAQFL